MQEILTRRELLARACASSIALLPGTQDGQAAHTRALRLDVPTETVVKELRAAIPELLTKHDVPGLSIALIRDGKLAWAQGFGLRNTESKAPVDTKTLFEAASLSKPTFGYYALKLCEQGVLGLDTPLSKYRKEPLIPDEPRLEKITARRVLSHTSGLPHGRPQGTPLAIRWEPGTEFHYSATGFDYLQGVVDALTGRHIAEYMRKNVLERFGMRDSSFDWQPEFAQRVATGYNQKGQYGETLNERYRKFSAEQRAALAKAYPEMVMPSAAAGMYTTASDYARLLVEIINPARRTKYHLSEKMTAEMLKPQIKVIDGVHWGIGWGLQLTSSADSFWHWGDWGIFRNYAVAYPKEKLGVVILTNSFHGLKLCKELAPLAVGGDHPAFTMLNV